MLALSIVYQIQLLGLQFLRQTFLQFTHKFKIIHIFKNEFWHFSRSKMATLRTRYTFLSPNF